MQQEPVDEDHPRRGRGQTLERVEERLLNPPGDDPGVILRLVGLGRTLLFDLGEHQLPTAELLEVSDLFVSHAHIDHFAGFDRLLRALIGHDRRVRIHGGAGITRHVQGKLSGYLWNLDFAALVEFEVRELSPAGRLHTTCFTLADRFQEPHPLPDRPAPELLLDEAGFQVGWARVDHGVECLAFWLAERDRFCFAADRLLAAGLAPGPHLAALKQRILSGREPMAESLGTWQRGRRIAYVTDCGFCPATVAGALRVAAGSDRLFCEATYPDREADKAARVHHLTGGQAGALAAAARVAELVPTHFSRRYRRNPGEILRDVDAGSLARSPWRETIREWIGEGESQ